MDSREAAASGESAAEAAVESPFASGITGHIREGPSWFRISLVST